MPWAAFLLHALWAPLGWVLLNLVPGFSVYCSLPLKRRKRGPLEALALSLVLSPVVFCVAHSVLGLAGAPMPLTFAAVEAVSAAAIRRVWLSGRLRFSKVEDGGRMLLLLALALTLMSAFPVLVNPELRLRTDIMLHAPVAYAAEAGIPPASPFVSGQKLYYYWFYDLFGALSSEFTGVGVIESLFVFNFTGFFAMLLCVWLLIRSIGGDKWEGLAGAAFLALSLNAYTGALLLYRVMSSQISLQSLEGVAGVLTPLGGWFASTILVSFLTTHSLSVCLPAMVAAAFALGEYRRGGGAGYLAVMAGSVFAAMAYHPPVGVYMVPAVGLVAGYDFLRGDRKTAVWVMLALAAASAAAMPYLVSISYGRPKLLETYLKDPSTGLTALEALFTKSLVVAGAFGALGAVAAGRRDAATAGMLLALSLAYVFINTPGSSSKNACAIIIPLSVYAAAGLRWCLSTLKSPALRAAAVFAVALLLLPANALTVYGYSKEKWRQFDRDTLDAFAEIAERTAPESVFIVESNNVYRPLLQAGRWNAFAFFPPLGSIRQLGYDESLVKDRQAATRELLAGRGLRKNAEKVCGSTGLQAYLILEPNRVRNESITAAFEKSGGVFSLREVGAGRKYGLVEIRCSQLQSVEQGS